jgi:histidine triad (HIT) family protein
VSIDCLFCRIAQGEIPADTVYEDDRVIAIRDINPQAPVHVLVMPRRHVTGLLDVEEGDESLIGHVARVAGLVARQEEIDGSGFRSVVNTGSDAQQSVPHLHLHVMGGRPMSWPPG